MICELVCIGKTAGISANSHKVIQNLLDDANKEAVRSAQNRSLRSSAISSAGLYDVAVVEIDPVSQPGANGLEFEIQRANRRQVLSTGGMWPAQLSETQSRGCQLVASWLGNNGRSISPTFK
jgi:hypothetical protein